MASCSFSFTIEDTGGCGHGLTVTLRECQKDITQHLNTMNVFGDDKNVDEMKLILARAGE